MEELLKISYQFFEDSLNIENSVFWRLTNKVRQRVLPRTYRIEVAKNCRQLNSVSSLMNASEEMMKIILSDDNLDVKSEVEVCEMLMKWLEVQTDAGHKVDPHQLLPLIRWSGVSVDYVKSKLFQNTILTSDQGSAILLVKVMTYLESGVQFQGLQTFHRPSTKLENCLVILGLGDGFTNSSDVCSISLQRSDQVKTLTTIPAEINTISSASLLNNNMVITGAVHKSSNRHTWTWNTSSGWKRCADMLTCRWHHGSAIVDSMLYVLGGLGKPGKTVLSSVECYNSNKNEWSSAGQLIYAVHNAASVAYNNSVYMFGGFDEANNDVAHVQVYNPAQQSCSLDTPMPLTCSHMRAVLWETYAILLCYDTCFVYNFDAQTYYEVEQFCTGLYYFALALDNSTLYIAGGGTSEKDKDNKLVWTCTDEVKSVSVWDIFEDKPADWKHHAKLTKPTMMHSYINISIPIDIEDRKMQF